MVAGLNLAITGATGFVGGRLLELALPQGQFAAVSSVPCGFASLSLVSLSRFRR